MEKKERWKIISAALDELLDKPEDQRYDLLEEKFGGDAEIYEELKRLLQAFESSGTFLESPAPYFEPLEQQRIQSLIGKKAGSYRVLQYIASGGMADIYLASRDDQLFEKKVAVKFLGTGPAAGEAIRRFEMERNILARLDHPNIARLIDAGVLDQRPYFIMEYVDGQPLDHYLAEINPDLKTRLELCLQILDTIQFAHQNLIVHRDLKPSNIFVDQQANIKLLDFGISKWLDPEKGITSDHERGLLSLEFAAPEQIRSEKINVQTDIYALGMILYLTLTGRHPFKLAGQSRRDLENAIVNEYPVPPSRVASTIQKTETYKYGIDSIPVPKLRGDLENIILKAISKSPEERYKTAAAFGDDIRNYSQNRPVKASKPGRLYRAGKFIARHKVGTTVAAAFMLLISAYLFTLQIQNQIITSEKQKAEAVTEFVTELFSAANPYLTEGSDTLQVRTLLNHASQRLEDELDSEPEVRGGLYNVLSNVYSGLGEYDKSLEMINNAIVEEQNSRSPSETEINRLRTKKAQILINKGRFAEANALLRELEAKVQHAGLSDQANVFTRLTEYYFERDKRDSALIYAEKAYHTNSEYYGSDHQVTLDSRRNLAVIKRDQTEYTAADSIFEELLDTYPSEEISSRLNLALIHNQYANSLYRQRRNEEAVPHYRKAIEIREELLGENHPTLANSLNNLSSLLQSIGEFEEALDLSKKVLQIYEEKHGTDHHYYGTGLSNHGVILRNLGRYDEAETALEQALDIRIHSLGRQHSEVANTYFQLANLHRSTGNYYEADSHFETSYSIMLDSVGERHPGVASILREWGLLKADNQNFEEARQLLTQSLELHQELFGEEHESTEYIAQELEYLE